VWTVRRVAGCLIPIPALKEALMTGGMSPGTEKNPNPVHSPRDARPEDLEPVVALLTAAGLPPEGIEDFFPRGYSVVETGNVIAAAAGVEPYGAIGLLRSVVVETSRQSTGLGRILVADRIDWARRNGILELYLLTQTAEAWFSRLGFRRRQRAEAPEAVRASPQFTTVCPDSAVLMSMDVNSLG
jgi:amino-acid N-acetyltransferase